MSTSVSQILSSPQVNTEVRSAGCQELTSQAQLEVERLTYELFFAADDLYRKSILMLDLGRASTSSLWLATGVASELGRVLRQTVHVLSVGSRDADVFSAWENSESSATGNCILEPIGDATSGRDHTRELSQRFPVVRAADECVIVHVSQVDHSIATLARTLPVDGVVLLIHAGRTRRAAITAVERQLAMAGSPLLGSVLLDRAYPIPEPLYRLL